MYDAIRALGTVGQLEQNELHIEKTTGDTRGHLQKKYEPTKKNEQGQRILKRQRKLCAY